MASGTACPTVSPGDALNSFSGSNTPPNGCTQVDVAFDNFNVSVDVGNNVATAPGIADVSLYASGALPTVDAFFKTPGTNNWSVSQVGGQLESILSYTATTTDAFTGLALPLSSADFTGTGSTFVITETYCLGQTTISSCPVGNSGSLQVTVAGSSIFIPSSPVTFAPTTVIAIQDEIVMQNGYTLLTLTNEFDGALTTPEPSTFVLLGSALAGLGLLGIRRRKPARG